MPLLLCEVPPYRGEAQATFVTNVANADNDSADENNLTYPVIT
jgi:hypothetical protein